MTQFANEVLSKMYREMQERKEVLGTDADSDLLDAMQKQLKVETNEQQLKNSVEKFKKLLQSEGSSL